MNELRLETGTNILIGKPAKPIARRQVKKISDLLHDIDEIREAHLPEVFAVGTMETSAPVLFIVVDPESAIPAVMEKLAGPLSEMLARQSLDVWPVGKAHDIVPTVRDANCLIGWRD